MSKKKKKKIVHVKTYGSLGVIARNSVSVGSEVSNQTISLIYKHVR